MFYFIHVLAGAVIAKFFPNLLLIIILSLISHFLIDIIPHKDSLFTKEVFEKSYKAKITKKAVLFELADTFVTLLLIAYIQLKFSNMLMLFSIFISLLPDILKIGYLTGLRNNKIFKKIHTIPFRNTKRSILDTRINNSVNNNTLASKNSILV